MKTITTQDFIMKACKKLLLAVMVIVSAVTVQSEMVWGLPNVCTSLEDDYKNRRINNVRPYHNRAASIRYDPSLICNQNALCGTLPGTFDYVYGQVGIYYRNTDLNRDVFVPLYVKEAALSDGSYVIPYMIPKWDGKILWMKINPNKAPLGLQPFYLDDDVSCSGCMEFISRSMLYKKNGVDYSGYPYNGVRMYMYMKVDADFRVKSYTIDIYDQDDNLAQRGLKLNIGDEVQMLYFEDDEDDTSLKWNSVSLEEFVLVTQEPVFEYAGYIPGRDFGCSYCTIDLPQTELFFRVVGYVHDALNDIDKPTYSQHQAMGKLSDNVCTDGSTNANCIYVVTPSAGVGGMVNPNTAQTVNYGTNKSFTVTANPGYTRNNLVGSTCPPGSWSNNVWTTGAITTNCTVSFSFKLCGDSDSNNRVNIVDALAVARYMVNLPPPPPINIVAADVDRNGQVTIIDALLIAKRSVGLVTTGTCF